MGYNVCLMFTGQLRTFWLCIDNLFKNLININNEYKFDIYFLLDKQSYSKKNNYVENNENIKTKIINSFLKYNKSLFIEIFILDINYPDYCTSGPFYVLYKNEMLINNIVQINKYNIFIRMRPDVIFINPLNLNSLNYDNKIHIISGFNTRNCFIHNRDWDYMCISDLKGIKLWCKYHSYLKNFKKSFPIITKFNNDSYWQYNTENISVSATQQLFEDVKNNNYELVFDSGYTFLKIIR